MASPRVSKPAGLAAASRRGVTWTGAAMLATTGGQALQTLAATWFMAPADYGLFVLALLVVGVLRQVTEAGFNEAVIVQRTATQDQLSALFTAGLGFATLAGLAIAAAALPLAVLVGDPRLATVLWVMAPAFPVLALGQVHFAVLERELRFDAVGRAEVVAAVAGLLTMVGLAAAGAGVLSLAVAALTAAVARTAVLLGRGGIGWRPGLSFGFATVLPYLKIAGYQMGTRLTNFGVNRLDQALIGTVYGPEALGLYGFAWTLIVDPILRLNSVANRVALPALARVRHSRRRLAGGLAGVLTVLSFATAPLIVGGAVAAPLFFAVVLPGRWHDAAPVAQILAVASLARSTANPIGAMAVAAGRVRRMFLWTAGVLAVQVAVFLVAMTTLSFSGFVAVVAGFNVLVLFAMVQVVAIPILGSCAGRLAAAAGPSVLAAATMGAGIAALDRLVGLSGPLGLALLVASGVVLYAGLVATLCRNRLRLVLRLVRGRRLRQASHRPDQRLTAG